jgi:heterodisulfide reductase subunit A-like polyferredoxin
MTSNSSLELVTMSSSGRSARVRSTRPKREKEPTGKMGVFLCRCGGSIQGRLDIDTIERRTSGLTSVDECKILDFSCSRKGQESISRTVIERSLDRFVIAGCSPKVIEDHFKTIAMKLGINPYMVEFANIREQCSLVHGYKEATEKAAKLIEAAVAKCALLVPAPYERIRAPSREVLVYGNGMSAIVATDELISEGITVHLISPFPLERLTFNYHGVNPIRLEEMKNKVLESQLVNIHSQASVEVLQGSPGEFHALLKYPEETEEISFGAAIIAWEAQEEPPSIVNGEILITQGDLETTLDRGVIPERTIMITLDESRKPISGRMTHKEAIQNALKIKEARPEAEVTIIARDVLAFGFLELDYIKAQTLGVRFIRTDDPPQMDPGRPAKVTVFDMYLGEKISLEADVIVTNSVTQSVDSQRIAKIFGTPIDQEGFFIPTQVKLKPAASIREGVFLCGSGISDKLPSEVVLEARGAASRAVSMLSSWIQKGGVVADIDPEKCSACLTCVRSCPYTAPFFGESGKAEVDVAKCQGCGICVGVCPSKAIELFCFTDDQLSSQTKVLAGEVIR